MFEGLTSLHELFLGGNGLRELPPGIFEGLNQVRFLVLWGNDLGRIPAGAFGGMSQLFELNLHQGGVTSFEPGVFDVRNSLQRMTLQGNRLHGFEPGALRGLRHLWDFDARENPGTPITFAPAPVALPSSDPEVGQPVEFAVEIASAAPFHVSAELSASGGTLTERDVRIPRGAVRSEMAIRALPDGRGPMTVRVKGSPIVSASHPRCNAVGMIGLTRGHCYRGVRVAAGPPLLLYGIEDRSLMLGQGPERIDLASVFSYFLGFAEYAAESSDGAVAAVAVEDGALTVAPGRPGAAEVTVTATAPDGETMTRRFSVTVRVPSAPLFPSGAHPAREGFVRLINRSGRAGEVRVTAIDDSGARRGPVALRLGARGAAHFNSGDLEDGNEAKGLADGVGAGTGDWRLEFETDLEVEALSYVRAADGFVTAMHDTAPSEGGVHRIATFNPASNDLRASRLRVVNPGLEPAEVTVRGVDDAGASPGGPVSFTVPAGGARAFSALELEAGGADLEGALGDGAGKWRLEVESDAPVAAMSLLEGAASGHLTNLSAGPRPPGADGRHHVPLLPAASGAREGFVRVINRSEGAGTVRIEAIDDAGNRHGPLELSIDGGAAAHFNSSDLEFGNAAKGLSGSAGDGEGDWRLELASDLDIGVLAYVRADDGFLTAVHEVAAFEDGRRRAVFFNPASNTRQVSLLRLVNPTPRDVEASVVGIDDAGGSPPNRGAAWITVPAGESLTLDAAELEAGVVSQYYLDLIASGENPWVDETYAGYWDRAPLGDGTGKWRLSVAAEPGLLVQSLLESPTGHLTNLSSDGR